jgi:hypothetical protein
VHPKYRKRDKAKSSLFLVKLQEQLDIASSRQNQNQKQQATKQKQIDHGESF